MTTVTQIHSVWANLGQWIQQNIKKKNDVGEQFGKQFGQRFGATVYCPNLLPLFIAPISCSSSLPQFVAPIYCPSLLTHFLDPIYWPNLLTQVIDPSYWPNLLKTTLKQFARSRFAGAVRRHGFAPVRRSLPGRPDDLLSPLRFARRARSGQITFLGGSHVARVFWRDRLFMTEANPTWMHTCSHYAYRHLWRVETHFGRSNQNIFKQKTRIGASRIFDIGSRGDDQANCNFLLAR